MAPSLVRDDPVTAWPRPAPADLWTAAVAFDRVGQKVGARNRRGSGPDRGRKGWLAPGGG